MYIGRFLFEGIAIAVGDKGWEGRTFAFDLKFLENIPGIQIIL